VKEGDKLVAVKRVKTGGREGGREGGTTKEGGKEGGAEEGFRKGVGMISRLKPHDFPVMLTFERGWEGGREGGGGGGREGGREVFDVVIPDPPLTRWGVVFGPSPPTEEEEEEKKEEEEGGIEGGREGGRDVWPVVKAFQRLPGPAQRSGKIKVGMVLLQINEEDLMEGGREGGVVERVGKARLPCSVTVRDMEVWTRMMAWKP